MSPIAIALKHMLAAGMDHDAIVSAVEEMENAPRQKSKAALRTARWRANKEASQPSQTVTRDAGDACDERVSPEPPSENTPIPPLKGGTFPAVSASPLGKPSAVREKSLSAWVAEIWEITSRPGRERSGRRDLENALKAATRRGSDPAAIKAGVTAYYASHDATKDDGQYAKGVHVVISSGRWEAFEPIAGQTAPDADPWTGRLRGWEINNYWNSEWGPKPGKPGCLAPQQTERAA